MGITERREREKTERRKAIINSAKKLIISHGVEHLSMEEIAHEAELSKATIYLYFSNKEVLFKEICEESALVFNEKIKLFLDSGVDGISAIKGIWQGYVEMFGNSDDMIIIFKLRNFLFPGRPFISAEQDETPYITAILDVITNTINRCKAEGFFDPDLDAVMATQLLLTLFSNSVEGASRIPAEVRKSPAIIEGMKKAFQIILYGFAKEGIPRSELFI